MNAVANKLCEIFFGNPSIIPLVEAKLESVNYGLTDKDGKVVLDRNAALHLCFEGTSL